MSKRKDRFNIYNLTVSGFEFYIGRECVERIKQDDSRRYSLEDAVALSVFTNFGTLHVFTEPTFKFDGRSGPKIIDFYVPNLGSIGERVCWLVHDINGYGMDLTFNETNALLYAMLRYIGYSRSKALTIRNAVSLSKSWYGTPKPDDWCYENLGKVSSLFIESEAS